MQSLCRGLKREGKRIGLVPTMGYLHEGHLSLFDAVRSLCDTLTASIFVNPAQFSPDEDFRRYPRDFDRDERLLREKCCDVVFYPSVEEMYPAGYATYIEVERLTEGLCGRRRKGHFRGVATVVTKLFMITGCDVAVFGQKDAQQAAVIRRMAADLNIPVEIIVAPIVREPDGLAMSSRNDYLTPVERRRALCLKKSLDMAEHMVAEGKLEASEIIENMTGFISQVEGAELEYIEAVDPDDMTPVENISGETLIALAVKIGHTRLIDNTIVKPSQGKM